jgi:hypothetical protein
VHSSLLQRRPALATPHNTGTMQAMLQQLRGTAQKRLWGAVRQLTVGQWHGSRLQAATSLATTTVTMARCLQTRVQRRSYQEEGWKL